MFLKRLQTMWQTSTGSTSAAEVDHYFFVLFFALFFFHAHLVTFYNI